MSQSESLKTDKELVWKKLSTLPRPTADDDLMNFWQSMGRGVRGGMKKGELNIIACGGRTGKSVFQQTLMEQLVELPDK